MAHNTIVTDDSRWPILYVLYPSNTVPDTEAFVAESEAILSAVHEKHGRGAPSVVFADLRTFDRKITPRDRKLFGDMLDRVNDAFGAPIAEGVVLRSGFLRLMVTALNFVQADKGYARRAFTDFGEAHAWLREEAQRKRAIQLADYPDPMA